MDAKRIKELEQKFYKELVAYDDCVWPDPKEVFQWFVENFKEGSAKLDLSCPVKGCKEKRCPDKLACYKHGRMIF